MSTLLRKAWLGGVPLCLSLSLLCSSAQAAPLRAVLERPAMQVTHPQQRVMLDLTLAGSRIVAVGERGLIAFSDDGGATWRQAAVPVSVTLTSVHFAGASTGWAIGHAGVVLRSDDGGASWRKQLDGRAIVALVSAEAQRAPALQAIARQLADDGPDKPLLAMHFTDASHGIVVGAYGLALATADGGSSWRSIMSTIDNPQGMHLYAIGKAGDQLWLAGEQGYLARASAPGGPFERVQSPYQGSLFSLLGRPNGEIIVAGLKGNVFRAQGPGAAFERIGGFTPVSVSAAALVGERAVFVNQAGQVHVLESGRQAARLVPQDRPGAPLAAVLALPGPRLVGAGVRGIVPVALDGGAP